MNKNHSSLIDILFFLLNNLKKQFTKKIKWDKNS